MNAKDAIRFRIASALFARSDPFSALQLQEKPGWDIILHPNLSLSRRGDVFAGGRWTGMRRMLALALCLAVLGGLLLVLPSLADGTVYFTAINNTLLALDEKTMPVIHNSQLYIPYSVFNSSDLGTYSLYSRARQLVLISDGDRILYFDMSAGNSYDDGGETYAYAAIYQNDTAYVPAFFSSGFFDIRYSYIRSEYGHIVRLTKGEALSDEAFLQGAAAIMESRLAQYTAARNSTAPPQTVPPQPTRPPATASPSPSPPVPPSASPRPDRRDTRVYIALLGVSAETKGYLDALAARGFSACFFVEPGDIRNDPELIRRILGSGCGVGVLFGDDLDAAYAEASALLREAARSVTFLAGAAGALDSAALEQAEETGLRIWCAGPGMDVSLAEPLLDAAEERCDLILSTGCGTGQFAQLLERLQRDNYNVCEISELVMTSLEYRAHAEA